MSPLAPSTGAPDLHVARALDPRALAPVFARFGRMHLPDVLGRASADALRARLLAETVWKRSTTSAGTSVVVPVDGFDAQPPEWRAQFDAAVRQGAARGFQYLFDSFAVSDEVEAGRRTGQASEAVYDFLNGPEFLGFVRTLTGEPRCAYVDAQVTRFGPGHFLTTHNDGVEGKNRLFAYVLNLTPAGAPTGGACSPSWMRTATWRRPTRRPWTR